MAFNVGQIDAFRRVKDLSEEELRNYAAQANNAFVGEFNGSKPNAKPVNIEWNDAQKADALKKLRAVFQFIADNMEVYNKEPERRTQARIALSADIGEANYNSEVLRQYALPPHKPTDVTHVEESGIDPQDFANFVRASLARIEKKLGI